MTPEVPAPIIIIKKKGGHGGHHGGAWKVAYADFVTAMMALFIVLWLLNSTEQVRKAISAYFLDPTGTGKQVGSSVLGTGETLSLAKDDMTNLKEKIEAAVKRSPEFEKLKDHIQMSVTGDGLRIELIEGEGGMFFESGSPRPTPLGHELIVRLTEELRKLPNELLIEGHTDSKPFASGGEYSNWELSTDRANAARRLIEMAGAREHQIVQVRGFADQIPRVKDHPEDPSNRRVSVIVRYLNATDDDEDDDDPPEKPAAKGEEKGSKAEEHGKAEH